MFNRFIKRRTIRRWQLEQAIASNNDKTVFVRNGWVAEMAVEIINNELANFRKSSYCVLWNRKSSHWMRSGSSIIKTELFMFHTAMHNCHSWRGHSKSFAVLGFPYMVFLGYAWGQCFKILLLKFSLFTVKKLKPYPWQHRSFNPSCSWWLILVHVKELHMVTDACGVQKITELYLKTTSVLEEFLF